MRRILLILPFLLAACNQTTRQWIDPDKTFATLPQPDVKGVNDTQEDAAKEAIAQGDFRRASQFYEQLVGSKKGSDEQVLRYKIGWADSLRRMGDNERALAMFSQLVREHADNLDAKEGEALCLMGAGRIVDASREFAEIMEKDPKRWRTLNALGILFVTKNMVPEAMAYYTEALKYSPNNPAVLNNVGLSQAVDRKYADAIAALGQAQHAARTPAQGKQIDLNLAMVYGVSGDLDTAKDIASKYLQGPALDNNLGLYAHLSKNDELARTYLNMALSQSPTYYERGWNNLEAVSGPGGENIAPPPATLPPASSAAP